MKSIKDYRKIKGMDDYFLFDVRRFLEGKKFKAEHVRSDKINGNPCLKIDLRIIEDRTEAYKPDGTPAKNNIGKVITVRIDHDGNETLYTVKREAMAEIVGKVVEMTPDMITGYYIYQGNSIILIAEDLDSTDEVYASEDIKRGDRALSSVNRFRTFDFNRMAEKEDIRIFGVDLSNKNELRMNAHLSDGRGMFHIRIPVQDINNAPSTLLTLDGRFKDIIIRYLHDYSIMMERNTKLLVTLKGATFAPGVLSEAGMTVGIIEERPVEREVNQNGTV